MTCIIYTIISLSAICLIIAFIKTFRIFRTEPPALYLNEKDDGMLPSADVAVRLRRRKYDK